MERSSHDFFQRLITIRDRLVRPQFLGVMGPLPNGLNCLKEGVTTYTVLTKRDDPPSMVGEAGGLEITGDALEAIPRKNPTVFEDLIWIHPPKPRMGRSSPKFCTFF